MDRRVEAVREVEPDVDGTFHAFGAVSCDDDRFEHTGTLRPNRYKRTAEATPKTDGNEEGAF
ncbi:hypothetical protein JCM18750_22490 [Halostagnicola bangensis]